METYESIYDKICRICCKPSNYRLLPLLDATTDDGLTLYGKGVQTFANVSIETDPIIPTNMCQHCFYLLKNAITFKLKCEENNKKLQKLVQNQDKLSKDNFKESFVKYIIFNINIFEREETGESIFIPVNPIPKTELKVENQKSDKDLVNTDEPFTNSDNDFTDVNDDDVKQNSDVNEEDKIDKYLDIMLDITTKPIKPKNKKNETNFTRIPYEFKRRPYKIKVKRKESQCDLENKNVGWKCNVCGKVLATKSSLTYHQQRHFGYKYICELCGKAYPCKPELVLHQANRHGIGKILSCQYCSFKTGRELDLREHVRLHTGERPFTCDKCGLTFRRKYLYTRHLVHHTEKTVQCPHCPKKFFHKTHMQAHCNTNHIRRYYYSCVRCGVKYTQSKTLRRHLSNNSKCADAYAGHTSRSLLRREDYIIDIAK